MKNRYHLYFASVPMVRIVVPILLGMMLQNQVGLDKNVLLIAVITSILLLLFSQKTNKFYRTSSGLLLTAILLLSGMFISNKTEYSSQIPVNEKIDFVAQIDGAGKIKANSIQYNINILKANGQTIWPFEKSICYISKHKDSSLLNEGQLFRGQAFFNEIKSPILDQKSSYKKYLNKNGCFTSVFLKEEQVELGDIESKSSNNFISGIHKVREKAEGQIHVLIEDKEVAGFLIAITLGNKEFLGKSQKQAFAQAGLMHMLAVSGLHLGIVVPLLMFLFGRRNKDHIVVVIGKSVLLLSSIWILAIFLGFSPSIQRAATMFTFLCLGKFSKYPVHSLNLLAASALFMILGNTSIIYDIGFQLSYSAMVGILMLYKPISQSWTIQNKIGDYIWKLSVVSICATLFTMPFSLYYFGTFPVLFLFTNILVLPVLPVLMYSTYAMLVIGSMLEILGTAIAFPLEYLGQYILAVAELCSSFSWASIQNIQVDMVQVLFLIVILFSSLALIYAKRFYKLAPLIVCLLLTVYTSSKNIYSNIRPLTTVQESINSKAVLVYKKGKHYAVISNENKPITDKEKQFNLYGTEDISSVEIEIQEDQFNLLANMPTESDHNLIASSD